jgi:hypothetical protein
MAALDVFRQFKELDRVAGMTHVLATRDRKVETLGRLAGFGEQSETSI